MGTAGYLGAILAGEGSEPAGTCFQLDGGVIITAEHVLDDLDANTVGSVVWVRALDTNKPAGTATVAAVDKVHDLAVLTTGHPFPTVAPPLLASDPHDPGYPVRITGVAKVPGVDSAIEPLPVNGTWQGRLPYQDGTVWGRVQCRDLMLGMSGAPVRRDEDDAIIGVVSSRYNSPAGQLEGSVWVARTEDLRPLLSGLTTVTVFGPPILDRATLRHWERSANGVMPGETGQRFRGRETALREIISWLDRPQSPRRDGKILVITGSPGAGKSAVLGRIVLTATGVNYNPDDPDLNCDDNPQARAGSVDCAVHATGKTALDVAREIARAASAQMPNQPEALPDALKTVLKARPRRFNLIIDALDEASSPAQARAIARHILVPIAKNCADVGVQVIVGMRQFDGHGNLLDRFSSASTVIDLDKPKYFELADLTAYAQATLQRSGTEHADSPYNDDAIARPVAERIAERADKNFLIAGLVAHQYAGDDEQVKSVDEIQFVADVEHLLTDFLDALPSVEGIAAARVLRALAYVQAPGVALELWRTALRALTGQTVQDDALWEFTQTSAAANFLIETTDTTTAAGSVFRLFHQALNDALLHRALPGGEAKVTTAFITYGRELGWDQAPAYLLRSLPGHAARTNLIEDLLTDPDYTLYADLRRLITAATNVSTDVGWQTITLLRRTPAAVDADPATRLALFSVTEVLDHLDTPYRRHPGPAPYRAAWANIIPRTERAILTGHTDEVSGVCVVRVDGRDLLVSAGHDGTVRIWDPATGQQIHHLTGHTNEVYRVCAVVVNGQDLLVSAGHDGTVRIWDPATGQQIHHLTGGLARGCVQVDGRDLLVSAGHDGTVRIWDPATGQQIHQLTGHTGALRVVCSVRVDGRDLIASASHDLPVRIWDPATGSEIHELAGHTAGLTGVCVVRVDGRDLLATTSWDRTVRIWDPATLKQIRQLTGHTGYVTGVRVVRVDGRDLLATTSRDRTVRIWDPATGQQIHQLTVHGNKLRMVCVVRVDGRDLLATASGDWTVRIWDPATGQQIHRLTGHSGYVNGICVVRVDGRDLLATAGSDGTVRIWDLVTGAGSHRPSGDTSHVTGGCVVQVGGRDLLATGDNAGKIWIWDLATGTKIRQMTGHTSYVNGICVVRVDGRDLLASASGDCTVRIWDPASGQQIRQLPSVVSEVVNDVYVVRVDGRDLLASAHGDTVRIWDPAIGQQIRQLTGRHASPVSGVRMVRVGGLDLLASSDNAGAIWTWDLTTGTEIRQLTGHTNKLSKVCVVRVDGRDLLASTSRDWTVRIWDPADGTEVACIPTYAYATALITSDAYLVIGLTTGLLTLYLPGPIDRIP